MNCKCFLFEFILFRGFPQHHLEDYGHEVFQDLITYVLAAPFPSLMSHFRSINLISRNNICGFLRPAEIVFVVIRSRGF